MKNWVFFCLKCNFAWNWAQTDFAFLPAFAEQKKILRATITIYVTRDELYLNDYSEIRLMLSQAFSVIFFIIILGVKMLCVALIFQTRNLKECWKLRQEDNIRKPWKKSSKKIVSINTKVVFNSLIASTYSLGVELKFTIIIEKVWCREI